MADALLDPCFLAEYLGPAWIDACHEADQICMATLNFPLFGKRRWVAARSSSSPRNDRLSKIA
jgi:hypothetical protein